MKKLKKLSLIKISRSKSWYPFLILAFDHGRLHGHPFALSMNEAFVKQTEELGWSKPHGFKVSMWPHKEWREQTRIRGKRYFNGAYQNWAYSNKKLKCVVAEIDHEESARFLTNYTYPHGCLMVPCHSLKKMRYSSIDRKRHQHGKVSMFKIPVWPRSRIWPRAW